MKSKDYIISNLNSLIKLFPHIKLRYEYDSIFNNHIIEVSPSSFYNDNEVFSINEAEFYNIFGNKFPDESIVFISNDDVIEINNITYTAIGDHYFPAEYLNVSELNHLFKSSLIADNTKFSFSFSSHKESLSSQVNYLSDLNLISYLLIGTSAIGDNYEDISSFSSVGEPSFPQNDIINNLQSNSGININPPLIDDSDENYHYALAA